MTEPDLLLTCVLLVTIYVSGRLCSWGIYQFSWRNAIVGDLAQHSAIVTLLGRLPLWPIHGFVLLAMWPLTWRDIAELKPMVTAATATVAVAAVLRFGAVDLGRFFLWDRIIAVACCCGVFVTPLFVYPALLASCVLQYNVSRWQMGPGYSNLLGFEFARGLSSALLAGMVFLGIWGRFGSANHNVTLAVQAAFFTLVASYYVSHALAKAALGDHWYSWMVENRIECLVVNSFLRGWRLFSQSQSVIRFATLIAKCRLAVCASVFFVEFGFLFALSDSRFLVVLLIAVSFFHIGVFVISGLAEVEFLVIHATLIWVFHTMPQDTVAALFGFQMLVTSAVCIALTFIWVGLNRLRIFRQCQRGDQTPSLHLVDPFDHLMAWWDSPYMRMYSYVVVADDGSRWSLPVPKLSPYDTMMTDIHTHIMILNRHQNFDPQAESDKQFCRSGVWGLVVTTSDRDRMYRMMDHQTTQIPGGESYPPAKPWTCEPAKPWTCEMDAGESHIASPLQSLFRGMNSFRRKWWYRLCMRHPHFPGEDLVPDVSPMVAPRLQPFRLDRDIRRVVVERIKTFYTGDQIRLLERSTVGTIEVTKSGSDAQTSNL